MGISKQKGRGSGALYEIKCISDIIKAKEAKGKDAAFERDLLNHWKNYKGYESAKETLAMLGKPTSSGVENGCNSQENVK